MIFYTFRTNCTKQTSTEKRKGMFNWRRTGGSQPDHRNDRSVMLCDIFVRCNEYEHLVPQMMYLFPESAELTQIMTAWANLYISLRSVAPTFQSVATASREYENMTYAS